jgi:hypothetical protein
LDEFFRLKINNMKLQKYLRDFGDTLESKDFNHGHRGRKIRKKLFKTANKRMIKEQNIIDYDTRRN